MMPSLGNFIIGSGLWFGLSAIVGLVIATTTNVAGAFGDKEKRRDAVDWLIWVFIGTGTVFVIGQAVYWIIHMGQAIKAGALLPGSG